MEVFFSKAGAYVLDANGEPEALDADVSALPQCFEEPLGPQKPLTVIFGSALGPVYDTITHETGMGISIKLPDGRYRKQRRR